MGLEANYAAATSPLRFNTEADIAPVPVPALLDTSPLTPPVVDAAHDEALLSPANSSPNPTTELPPDLLPYRDKLLRLMAEQQLWLDADLNLAELARKLDVHPVVLSKVLNTVCGQSFSDFVNTYRVQEACRKLADPAFGHYSLLGIALESGFNSKSTFNRVFKKLLGSSPSDFKRPIL